MKTNFSVLIATFSFMLIAISTFGQIKHDFICVDNFKDNRLIRINENQPEKSWVVDIPNGSRDLQRLSKNKLLVSHANGAAIYHIKTGKQFSVIADSYSKIQSAQYHKDGHYYLLTIDGEIYKLNKKGEELEHIVIQKDLDVRLLRFTTNGDFLISCKKPTSIIIVKSSGEITEEITLMDKGYKALQLSTGNFLNTAGDEVKVVELNPNGEIVNFVGGKNTHPSLNLDYCSGWELLPNDHIVMCNWLGHNKHGSAAHLIEFTENNNVVWQWEDHKLGRQITNVLIIR